MFNKLIVLGILSMSAHGANPEQDVKCFNGETTFKLINEGNPRNGASARISASEGLFPFGGTWLWPISTDSGYLNSQTKYKTMNGGTLTISNQVVIGRGGWGRGSWDNELKSITAYFESVDAAEFIYDCNKICN